MTSKYIFNQSAKKTLSVHYGCPSCGGSINMSVACATNPVQYRCIDCGKYHYEQHIKTTLVKEHN